MKKICPRDKNHNSGISPGDTFCYICGSQLVEYNGVCECGKDCSVYDHFCTDCGRPVK